jgi:flagellar biogenesis protein FliO
MQLHNHSFFIIWSLSYNYFKIIEKESKMSKLKKIFRYFIITTLLCLNLYSNESFNESPPETVFPNENYLASLTKMFFMVLILIALLILTVWLLKKFLNSRMHAASIGKAIQILEQRTISPKSILYLVEVDGEKFLIAESQVQVQKIESLKIPIEKNQNAETSN